MSDTELTCNPRHAPGKRCLTAWQQRPNTKSAEKNIVCQLLCVSLHSLITPDRPVDVSGCSFLLYKNLTPPGYQPNHRIATRGKVRSEKGGGWVWTPFCPERVGPPLPLSKKISGAKQKKTFGLETSPQKTFLHSFFFNN